MGTLSLPLRPHQLSMQRHTVVSLRQGAPLTFIYNFSNEENEEAPGTLESLHSLSRWDKWGPEKWEDIPKICWLFARLGMGTPVCRPPFCPWISHPTVGWQCRVSGPLWRSKSHNKQPVTKYANQHVWCLQQHASSLIFSPLGWFAFQEFSKILLLLKIPRKLKCLLETIYWALTICHAKGVNDVSSQLILTTTSWGGLYSYPHFTDKERSTRDFPYIIEVADPGYKPVFV